MPDIVGAILGKEKRSFVNRPSKEWVLEDTTIGVEVEVEGVNFRGLDKTVPAVIRTYWEWHEDPSLHNHGAEFTFRNPLFGEDARIALVEFMPYARKEGFATSLRTGIHVHLDARDLSRYQLLGLLAYYAIFEPALYAWVGDDRHSNNFCLPWYKFEGALQQAIGILSSMRDFSKGKLSRNEDVILSCEEFHRYAGLNLKSLAAFGSIEFRQLKTSLEYERVKTWINIILALKRAAMQVPESTFVIIHDLRRRGIEQAARSIFGENVAKAMWKANPLLTADIEEHSLPNAIELIAEVQDQLQQGGQKEDPKVPLFNWYSEFDDQKIQAKDHPGFLAWRRKNYPKDLKLKREKPPPNPFENLKVASYFASMPQMVFTAGIQSYNGPPPEVVPQAQFEQQVRPRPGPAVAALNDEPDRLLAEQALMSSYVWTKREPGEENDTWAYVQRILAQGERPPAISAIGRGEVETTMMLNFGYTWSQRYHVWYRTLINGY